MKQRNSRGWIGTVPALGASVPTRQKFYPISLQILYKKNTEKWWRNFFLWRTIESVFLRTKEKVSMTKERILIVEDDDSIRRLLEVALNSQGFEAIGFDNAIDALEDMGKQVPSLVTMDIMMDRLDGIEALKIMRSSPNLNKVPVILLSAKDMENDKIGGLDAGADDYMTKPFSVLELCARIRALLRRTVDTEHAPQYQYGGLRINPDTREVWVSGEPVELTYKEFELLKFLMEHPNKSLSRQQLLQDVWGTDFPGETRTLDIHIGTLRQKLGDSSDNSRYIKTVRGVGYRFLGDHS
jgi:two-component system alkaline phosphatase synthesis response regulator PhoP